MLPRCALTSPHNFSSRYLWCLTTVAKPGRNDPCPCGSGKKYKICCGTAGAVRSAAVSVASMVTLDNGQQVNVAQAIQSAVQLHQAGQLQQAERLYQQVLQINPNHADALHLLGVIAYQVGKNDIAVELLGRAITHNARESRYHFNLGNALRPLGRLAEAEASYRTALKLKPNDVDAHNNLGIVLKELGRWEDAIACYRAALRLQPADAEAHTNLGALLVEHGNLSEAMTHCREAIRLNPALVEAHNNLGSALKRAGQLAEAESSFREALRRNSDNAETHNNLGLMLWERGELESASLSFREAIRINPGFVEAHNNLGIVMHALGKLPEAVAAYREALRAKADFAAAHFNLGGALQAAGKLLEAVASYREALRLKTDYPAAQSALIHQLQHLCEWSQLEPLLEQQRQRVQSDPGFIVAPFAFICTPSSAAEQFACARKWAQASFAPYAQQREGLGFTFSRSDGPRLRIGYLSADLHEHATAYLLAELLEVHDRARFEVIAYSYGPDDGSAMRKRLVAACDRFVDIRSESFVEAAQRIHADAVDILVDLKGYTESARTGIMALRPAPVQVNYLGYPGTMGVDFIDYIITDRFVSPPEHEPFYSERFAYLPDCYQINDSKRAIAEPAPTRAQCGLPEQGFVFCCFNSNYKITPEVFAVWMRLLKQIPGSVLWLLESNATACINLRREAQAHGVDAERLVFAPRLPLPEHLARHHAADLFLDTLPVNAHTTASDALWAGLPIVTCAGETFIARVAGSLLTVVGLPELITESLADYETLTIHLAHHPDELAALRQRLEAQRRTTPLFDSTRFARHLEMVYQMMWEIHCAGELPRRIEVG